MIPSRDGFSVLVEISPQLVSIGFLFRTPAVQVLKFLYHVYSLNHREVSQVHYARQEDCIRRGARLYHGDIFGGSSDCLQKPAYTALSPARIRRLSLEIDCTS